MVCPHCGSNWFDGVYCYHCTRSVERIIPSFKYTKQYHCKQCGKQIIVHVCYGEGSRTNANKDDTRYCQPCKDQRQYDYNVDYRTEKDLTTMSKKRRKQYFNYLEYIGELYNLKREMKGKVTRRAA